MRKQGKVQIQLFEGLESLQKPMILLKLFHSIGWNLCQGKNMDRVVLGLLTFRKVFKEQLVVIRINQVDGLDFFEFLPFKFEFLDSSDSEINQFHLFYRVR